MKLKPYSKKWEQIANVLARDYCPTIYPCKECNHPVISGYVCEYCGNTNPTKPKEQSERKLV